MKRLLAASVIAILPSMALAQMPEMKLLSLIEAVEAVEQKVPGHVIEADMDHEKGRYVYDIEVVKDNDLSKVKLDAQTGEIISIRKSWLKNTWREIWNSDYYKLPGAIKPLSETLKRIEQDTTGQIRKVDFDVEGNVAHYEIEVISAAGETDIYLDARTGERLPAAYSD
jgi:uncharacterized membrane protein YkoI